MGSNLRLCFWMHRRRRGGGECFPAMCKRSPPRKWTTIVRRAKLSRPALARTQEVRQTARGVVYRGLIFELHGAEMVCCSSCLVSAGF